MQRDVRAPWRDRTAIAGSIAFHLCVLAALAAWPRPLVPPSEPDERALLATVVRIERLPPRPRSKPHSIERATTGASIPAALPPLHPPIAISHAAKPPAVSPEAAFRPHPSRVAAPRPAAPPLVAARAIVAVVPETAVTPTAVPTPTPSPPPAPTAAVPAIAADRSLGVGNLGDTWDARPMPGMVAQLRAQIGGHAVVAIDLDEHGRALSVTFVSGIADAALRETIRGELLAASYIPARCSGLDCASRLTLTL